MGAYWGPQKWWQNKTLGIITDGLFFNLDAANPSSYSGSGTVWYDISGNNRHATITNVSYSSENGGVMLYSGTSSAYLGNPSVPNPQFTVSAWVYDTSNVTNSRAIIGKIYSHLFRVDSNSEGGNLSCFVWINGNSEPRLSTPWTKNSWTNVAYTWNADGNFRIYVNGILRDYSISRNGTWSDGGQSLYVGSDVFGNNWIGKIAQACMYTRSLSDSEILYNYNALKGRYGL